MSPSDSAGDTLGDMLSLSDSSNPKPRLSGCSDEWTSISIGETRLEFAKRCGRCLVTTADQLTGERHHEEEPLRTLARERKFGNAACFGSFYAPKEVGRILEGDRITVA